MLWMCLYLCLLNKRYLRIVGKLMPRSYTSAPQFFQFLAPTRTEGRAALQNGVFNSSRPGERRERQYCCGSEREKALNARNAQEL